VQGVNGVGEGSWSSSLSVHTRALPPSAPTLELLKATHNSLKIFWGDKKVSSPDHTTYCLQLECTNANNNRKE